MNQMLIFWPVLALAALTIGIGVWLGRLRFALVKSGLVSARYYELNRGSNVPDELAKVSNNYDNLLALPMLFYVITAWLYMTNNVVLSQLVLAWIFVISRYAHSYIHTGQNDVRRRMNAFLIGVGALILMWLVFLVQILQA